MSALPPKADMCSATRYVRFVPIADIVRLSHYAGGMLIRRHENGPGNKPEAVICHFGYGLVSSRKRYVDAFLLELLSDPFEPLIVRQGDRARVGFTLQLTRRILDVSFH